MLTTVHFIIVIGTLLIVLYADEQGFMWMLGKKQTLDAVRLHLVHVSVAVSLGLLIITGGLLYYVAPTAYLSNGIFDIKMISVAALILNTYAIARFSPIASVRAFTELSNVEKLPLLISGAVSVLGWVVALVCGLSLGE